jgi:hypothetical protein
MPTLEELEDDERELRRFRTPRAASAPAPLPDAGEPEVLVQEEEEREHPDSQPQSDDG